MTANDPSSIRTVTPRRADADKHVYRAHYRFCRWDAVVVLFVLLLAGGLVFGLYLSAKNSLSASSHKEAVLTVDGTEVWRVSLSGLTTAKEYTVTGNGEKIVVQAENGEARVLSSTCRDQVCVRTGWISGVGQTAVCLPYRVVLRIDAVGNGAAAPSDTNTSYDVISK